MARPYASPGWLLWLDGLFNLLWLIPGTHARTYKLLAPLFPINDEPKSENSFEY